MIIFSLGLGQLHAYLFPSARAPNRESLGAE
jgi:hypothetical protein